ncbi:MAG: TraX family protein [Eubacteriales bacterium]|nr:TraX family protein [Eubacteriales bacterium]
MNAPSRSWLTGNQLKIIAMAAMTIDHIGAQLLPQYLILRIIGRLAMPIYAYMIAEGCRYTRSRGRYLGRLAGLAALCQLVYFFAMDSLYMCILVTFSLSVALIWALEWGEEKNRPLVPLALAAGIYAVCQLLPRWVPGFYVDYGFFGVLLPVAAYFGKTGPARLFLLGAGLVLLASDCGGVQWYSLAAIPLLALYNGQRGKASIGPLFYWYYPAHLVAIHLIGLLLR